MAQVVGIHLILQIER